MKRNRAVCFLHKQSRRFSLAAVTVIFFTLQCSHLAHAGGMLVSLSPPDDVTQKGVDFHDLFNKPERWRRTAGEISALSIPARYLLTAPEAQVRAELTALHTMGVRLDVAILALPVDKKICGNHIEGTVWPNEPAAQAKRLKVLGADVFSFSLDLPLNAAYFQNGVNACHLTIRDAANRTAQAVAAYRALYPAAKFIDIEVPTGVPAAEWSSVLASWLTEFHAASGRDFDGLFLDAWWLFDWRSAIKASVDVAAVRRIPVGVFIDASGAQHVPAATWIAIAKQNACDLKETGLPIAGLSAANWQNMNVPTLPEGDPNSLTGLASWLESGPPC